ncbi:MAG TPA: sodium:proton antiporter, partial [Chthoniobacterales bacterium]|nr:sodium:proton antiporter [Chthoniobacterales bacterium]
MTIVPNNVMSVLNFVAAEPNRLAMLPFAVLLVAIAFGPLIAQHHWERHYHKLCVALAGIVCLYYLVVQRQPGRVVHAGIDYATFMVVVGAFFVVAGGIHLRSQAPSSPLRNTLFLLAGAVLANLIGTIAASLLLIRPWIEMNRGRIAPMHIAFFIFVVSNVGGALLPVVPPLLLGYLNGVPFSWTLQHCWQPWSVAVALILLVFFIADLVNWRTSRKTEKDLTSWRCDGAHNFIFLFVILAAIIAAPAGWREPLVVLTAFGSYLGTPNRIREANNFSFLPLKEIAWLFLGIFGTMIPVLEFMEGTAGTLGLNSDLAFFWATGLFSALLDNAPTYLAFFAAALGRYGLDANDVSHVTRFLSENGSELIAISVGATFFGALTYIGNAPNLLVKTIAEHA